MYRGALSATKAAAEEGILPGGGVAFVLASQVIERLEIKGDELIGALALKKALQAPLKQLAVNAGKDGAVILSHVATMKPRVWF